MRFIPGFVAAYGILSVLYLNASLVLGDSLQLFIVVCVAWAALIGVSLSASKAIASGAERLAIRVEAFPLRRWMLGTVALGVAIRLACALFIDIPMGSGGRTYFALAQTLHEAGVYRDPRGESAYWPPGLPFVYYAHFMALGVKSWVPLVVNLELFVITALGVYAAGHYMLGEAGARVGALLIALWPNHALAVDVAGNESLVAALLALALWLYLMSWHLTGKSGRNLALLGVGAALGFATLAQPAFLLFPVALVVHMLLKRIARASAAAQCSLIIAAMVVVVCPWTYRNYVSLGQLIPVSTNGGDVFYRANNPLATGGYIDHGERDLTQFAELERNHIGYMWGHEWIMANPGRFLALAVKKQILFLGDDSVSAYELLKRGREFNSLAFVISKGLSNIFWLALWVVILVAWRQQRVRFWDPGSMLLVLSLLYLLAIHSVFESGARYHMPLVGALALLTASLVARPVLKPAQAADSAVESGFAQPLANQFLTFAGVGAIGTTVHYAILVLLVSATGANPVAASVLGSVAGAVTNYLLNYNFTFRSRKRHREAAIRFLAVAGTGLLLNALLMEVLVVQTGLHYFIGQILTTGIVLVWNFAANRVWTFAGDAHGERSVR